MKRADQQHRALNSSPSFLYSPRGVHWKSFTRTMDIPPVRQQTAKWGNEAVKKREFQIQRLKLPPQPHTQNHCQQPRTKIYHFESKARFSQEVGATKTVIFFQPVLEIFWPGVRLVTLVTSQRGLCFVSGASTFKNFHM